MIILVLLFSTKSQKVNQDKIFNTILDKLVTRALFWDKDLLNNTINKFAGLFKLTVRDFYQFQNFLPAIVAEYSYQ